MPARGLRLARTDAVDDVRDAQPETPPDEPPPSAGPARPSLKRVK
jgi:hypothetical protein